MRRVAAAGVVALAVLLWTETASAHPLGNFTVNHYAGITVRPDRVDVDYVVDRAEIPAYQVRDAFLAAPGRWARRQCAAMAAGLRITVQGRALPVQVTSASARTRPGAAGLETLRLECGLSAPARLGSPASLAVHDANHARRLGWREITAVGDGVTMVDSDVPATSLSAALTAYPDDRLQSPPATRRARVRTEPTGAPAAVTHRADTPVRGGEPGDAGRVPTAPGGLADRYTALVARQRVTVPFLAGAAVLAVALGAVHALAPGHGKAVIGAYLVAGRGRAGDAAVLGLTVATAHTAGVVVLGVALAATRALAPERLYPWLTLASGLLFVAVGATLARAALRRRPHDHAHHADHGHGHHADHGHGHSHGHGHVHEPAPDRGDEPVRPRRLLTLGLAGGMVPTPSALVVLLGAMALGRLWLGVALVVLYGVGMAAVLVGAGLLLASARDRLARRHRFAQLAHSRVLPALSAAVVVTGGLAVVARAMAALT